MNFGTGQRARNKIDVSEEEIVSLIPKENINDDDIVPFDEIAISTIPDGLIPEKYAVLFILAKECPICGNKRGLCYILEGRQICETCYKKIKSIKSKKELVEWLKELTIEEEELIPDDEE